MRKAGLVAIALALLTGHANARADAVGPGPRNKPGFVYDAARGTFLLFGGFGGRGQGARGDTWRWEGTRWTEAATPGPSARGAMGMAYDAGRKKVVLFGGANAIGQLGDTWEWDGTAWKEVSTPGPSPRAGMQLVYDSDHQQVVGFGGFDQTKGHALGETWAWDGVTWRLLSASGPSPRTSHGLAYDARRKRVVLFGGNQAPPAQDGVVGDTWEWDGVRWTKVADSGPARRDHHAMAFDSARGRVVVFGGWNGEFMGDTWEWDGTTWTEASTTGPSPRGGVPSLGFDSTRQTTVLFGGWDATGAVADVWEWNGRWAPAPAAEATPTLAGTRAGGLRTGPHAVGFEVRSGIDASRRINGTDVGTRVGLAIWYPARWTPGAGSALTAFDYRLLDSFRPPDARERQAREDDIVNSLLAWRHIGIVELTAAQARASLATYGLAVSGAPPLEGRFPVVVVMGGPYYLSTTAEIIASHGFLVVAPFRVVDQSNEIGTAGFTWYLENNVRDAEWALVELKEHAHADLSRVAAIGHGGGGMQAMLLAMRNRLIGALVNIDAGNFSTRSDARAVPFFAPRLLRIPYLYVATADTRKTQDRFEDFLAMRFSDRLEVVLDTAGLRHHDLSDLGRAVTAPMGIRGEPQAGVQRAYADVHEMTVRFLRQHAGLAEATAEPLTTWLSSHGAPGRFTTTVHAGVEPAPTTVRVLETLDRTTPALLRAAKTRDPEAPVFEPDSLASVVEKALRLNDPVLASALAALAVDLHPASAQLLELSSQALEAGGDVAGALGRATACAAVDPGNDWRATGAVARCRARAARLSSRSQND